MARGQKRNREEDEDGDPVYGMRQILPVAALPADYNGEPMDGMQYLFTVRRDARKLPNITRAPNPYEKAPSAPLADVSEDGPCLGKNAEHGLPLESWRTIFEHRFRNFRVNSSHATTTPMAPARFEALPNKKDREAWWHFISGAPEPVWSKAPSKRSTNPNRQRQDRLGQDLDPSDPSVTAAGWQLVETSSFGSKPLPVCGTSNGLANQPDSVKTTPRLTSDGRPREPIPALIQRMDHRISVHIIMYFTYWINLYIESPSEQYLPLESHARWIFALLSRVDAYCTADEMSGLRALVRACLTFLRTRLSRKARSGSAAYDISSTPGADSADGSDADSRSEQGEAATGRGKGPEGAEEMSDSSIWLIVCAVAGFWGQRDLWEDALGAVAGS